MLKTCPLTKASYQPGNPCPKQDCSFWMVGGCAIVLAAQFAEDNQRGLHIIAEKLGVRS